MQEQSPTGNFCAPKNMLPKRDPLRWNKIFSRQIYMVARPVWTWVTDMLPDIATVLVKIIAVPPAQLARHPSSAVSSAMRSSAVYLGRHCINT